MTFHTLIRWPVAMETASSSYSKTLRASFVAPWPHTMASEISTVPNLLGCTMVTCGSFPLEWSQFKYIRLGPYLDRHRASIPPLNIGAVKNVGSCWFSVVWPSNFHLYLRYLMRPATFPRGDSFFPKPGNWGLILLPVLCGGSRAVMWSPADRGFRSFSPLADERTEGCRREPLADDGAQGGQKRADRSSWVSHNMGWVCEDWTGVLTVCLLFALRHSRCRLYIVYYRTVKQSY